MKRGEAYAGEYRDLVAADPRGGSAPATWAPAAWAAAALLLTAPAAAQAREGPEWTPAALAEAGLQEVALTAAGHVQLATVSPERNLALGSTVTDDLDRKMPLTDGVTDSSSEWLSGTPSVYGRAFTVDLGRDRAITRVRVLAGGSTRRHPEYFMRGYRLQAATDEKPDLWHLLAEERENDRLDVDTAADSTWRVVDESGQAAAQVGRYVRLTLIRQDRSNWVSLGDIEVYGAGFSEEGRVQAEVINPEPRNIGRLRWQVEVPPGTSVQLQFREGGDPYEVAAWSDVEAFDARQGDEGVLFPGREPLSRLDYRVTLRSRDPLATPVLRRLEVEGEARLVAHAARASMAPDAAVKGEVTEVTYLAEVAVEPGDYGIDLLRLRGGQLEVGEVLVDGRRLGQDPDLARGYRWHEIPDLAATIIELAADERLTGMSTIRIRGRGLFLQDRAEVRLAVGSAAQADRDGFTNWQNGREIMAEGWTVVTTGAPPPLLGPVTVAPRPFNPFTDEQVTFELLVGNLRATGQVRLGIYGLDGRRLVQLTRTGQARLYRLGWDGRDESGRRVEPGLYLYEVAVDAGDHGARRSGTVVVAY